MLNLEKLKNEVSSIEKVLPLIREMSEKRISYYDIAMTFEKQGVRRSNGKPWVPWAIARLLEANNNN